MNSRRTARVASVIREVVSNCVLFELRDPRIANVTVTRVEVSGDLQHAKVYVSVMGDDKARQLCMHGLNSSRGYLQSKLAERVKTRYTPQLRFVLDEGIRASFEVMRIIKEVLPSEPQTMAEAEAMEAGEDSAAESADVDLGEESPSTDDGTKDLNAG